ncbi:MAG: pyruvate kinase [Endozoicomonadaceae bacterium]|nr:pyruvate kinase [Endozoicomonadaceae bacterium]
MLKRTKIVATLGPASHSEAVILKLIQAGVDVVRLNFSHGQPNDHIERAKIVRKLSQENNKHIAILGDLQGPKIRIKQFKNQEVLLKSGHIFQLSLTIHPKKGDEKGVGITDKNLIQDCKINHILLLDDGNIKLKVASKTKETLTCKVIYGGILSDNKGINLEGGGLSTAALTEKDKKDIKLAAKINVDYLALSFVRNPDDILLCRQLFKKAGGQGGILAKIERAEVVASQEKLKAIIQVSDAVMVARGDLGVEIGDAALVAVQKNMIKTARDMNCPVITATQMMDSMINKSQPTRAEVFDVANAVLDNTDAVMLSAETAAGKHPSNVVKAMHRITQVTEKNTKDIAIPLEKKQLILTSSDQTIAVSAMYAANHLAEVKGLICFTKSGQTALWMSRINSILPIFAFSHSVQTCRRMALYRGVHPLQWQETSESLEEREHILKAHLKRLRFKKKDKFIITFGSTHKITNTLQLFEL